MKKIIYCFGVSALAFGAFFTYECEHHKNNRKNYREEKERPSAAKDALQFMSDAAAFPNNDIPPTGYSKAMAWYIENNKTERSAAARTSATQTGPVWQNIGPRNQGGRTLAIAIDPIDTATLWLGSASGGMWKSTSGGIGANAWNYVPLGFQVLGVSSIAIQKTNHNVMFVGTGEVYCYGSNAMGLGDTRVTRGSYGMGIFKSINGGSSWSQVLNWTYQQNRGVWDIVINPLNPNSVYAATTEGVYKSTDGGITWNLTLNQLMCMDLEMLNADTNILLCGVGNNGTSTSQGLYRTSNSGGTWARVSAGLPAASYAGRVTVAKNPTNNDTLLVHIADVYNTVGIYKSIDKGLTWTQITTTDIVSYQGWYCKGLAIQPGNINNVLGGGVNLYQSTTGGTSFSTSGANYHSDIHDIVVNPSDPNKIYILTDGGLFRSNDWGNTAYECTGGYVTTQHYIGAVSATDTTVLLSGLQDNYTIKYFGGYTWQAEVGGDGCYCAIDHTNDFIQYGAYQYLNVYKDNTRGNTFGQQILTNSSSATGGNYAAFLAPYLLCHSNTNYIYAGGQALQLSTTGGNSFSYMGANPLNGGMQIMAIACSFTNTDSVYFATNPDPTHPMKMFFSANQGANVTDISAGLPNRYPRRIAVNPTNSSELYAVFSGFGTGHVFKSVNAGASWTDVSTLLPDMPFECVVVDPLYPANVYVGCDFGVFYSQNKGLTWTAFDAGFPDATMVFDLEIAPSARYLYAFTFGRGVFKRSMSDLTTGIANTSNKKDMALTLFPNPTSNDLQIQFPNDAQSEYMAVIYDLSGREISKQILIGGNETIPVSNLNSGTYIISLRKNSRPYLYGNFVKQ